MKSRIILTLAIILATTNLAFAQFAGGDGSSGNPWQITNWEHLNNVRLHTGSNFILMADLDPSTTGYDTYASSSANSGAGWQPMNFSGSLNGNGHTITGLFIDRPSTVFVGLFGTNDGEIDSLGLVGVDVTGGEHSVGGMAGYNKGTIRYSYTTGSVSAGGPVGGLAGQNREGGTIIASYSTASVCCDAAGGLVGHSFGVPAVAIINSYATGRVTGEFSGGFVAATNAGTITASYWNTETAGQASSDGGTGLTTTQMTQEASFSGWDFTTSGPWAITEGLSYPWLQWQGSAGEHNIPRNFPPHQPQPFSEDQQVSLVWHPPVFISSLTTLEGYNIYRDDIKVNGSLVTDTTFTDTGLNNLQEYSYNISGVYDSSGATIEAPTDTLQVTPNVMAGGLGTQENPWQIATAEQLNAVRNLLDAHYILTADIALATATGSPGGAYWNSGSGWLPIGGIGTPEFTGSLNGDGHTITGLFINRPVPNKVVGLIGTVTDEGRVENLGLAEVDITGYDFVGSLAGRILDGTITNCFATGSVSGNSIVGGLVGINNFTGNVTSSYTTARVSGSSTTGGLLGVNGSTITDSYWNTETSGQANGFGSEFGSSTVTGLTTAQMLDPANFSGFDFVNTWDIYEGFGFPFLRGESPQRTGVVQITGSEGWHMMTAPVSETSYGELLDTLWTQGFTGADTNNPGDVSNVYTWDETGQQFISVSNANDVPAAGSGFIVYVYDDQDYNGTPEGFPKTLLAFGNTDTSEVALSLSYTDSGVPDSVGWNLVGNPYAQTIDWDASGWTKTNLNAPVYIWSDSAGGAGDYLTWSGGTGTLPGGLIAPFQGFWVQASGASPVLEFTDDVRSAGGVFYKDNPVPQIRFRLNGNDLHSNAIVMLHKQAEEGKDPLDAWKLQPLNQRYLSLYTTATGGQALDINALPLEIEQPLELTMDFEGSDLGGEYTLSWNPKDLPEVWPQGAVILTDLYTDRIIALDQSGDYTFEVVLAKSKGSGVQPPPNHEGVQEKPSKGLEPLEGYPTHGPIPTVLKAKSKNPRFLLTINPAGSGHQLAGIPESIELNQNYPNPFNPETVIRYGVPEQSTVQLTVFDILGRKVVTLLNEQKSPGRYQVNFDASRFASGLYIYRLDVGGNVLTKKMMLIK